MNKLSKEIKEYQLLMHNVPQMVLVLFCISVVLMNILANKEVYTGSLNYLAFDCGFSISWLSFLCMDMLTKRFGPKASIEISITALVINLGVSGMLFLVSLVPGNWSAFYISESPDVNIALNSTIGGTWYVVIGSSVAFIVSSIVNSYLNWMIGKMFKRSSFAEYAIRSYLSTAIGQFVDNFVFATIVSKLFFGWTWTQVVMCSITAGLFELICEIVFSPIGYKVCNKWSKDNVGKEYVDRLSNI